MKTAIVLASIALLAGIANHGCESAPANQKSKISRVLRAKDRLNQSLKDLKDHLDAWRKEEHTLEERAEYMEELAADVTGELFSLDDEHWLLYDWVDNLDRDFDAFKANNDWDAIRRQLAEDVKNWELKEECWETGAYGPDGYVKECKWVISMEDEYNYDYAYDYDYYGRRIRVEKKAEE